MGGNEHGHTQLNCYAAVLIYVYLCSLRTVTLAVGILFRLGRVVGDDSGPRGVSLWRLLVVMATGPARLSLARV